MKKMTKVMTVAAVMMTSTAMAQYAGGRGAHRGGHIGSPVRGGMGHVTRIQLEMQAKKLSSRLAQMIQNRGDTLTKRELKKVVTLLQDAKQIVKHGNVGTVPPVVRPPVVRPPVVRPPVVRPPVYNNIPCNQAGTYKYQTTFTKIKNFAYSSSGLNKTTSGATNYAHDWTAQYSCNQADKFIQDFKRLKNFAYSSSGLNKTTSSAINFASNKIESLCVNFPLESKFSMHFNFAYSSSGLNMTSSSARNYAYDKIEYQAFSCRNF